MPAAHVMPALEISGGAVRYRTDALRPEPEEGWALVEVALAGICGTDLQLLAGYAEPATVPGHEFVGRVVAGADALRGERVVADINVGCGNCARCTTGGQRHCASRRVLGIRGLPGAFATHVAVPESNLIPVPTQVSDRSAVFAEPLAAALRVLEQVETTSVEPWLVVGPGRLGQLVARVLHASGRKVALLGRRPGKLERARAAGVACLPPGARPEAEFAVAVDCTGDPAGLRAAVAAVRPGGTVVLKSTHAAETSLDPVRLVVEEIRVVGSRCGSLPDALETLAAGRVQVEDLVDAVFPLSRGAEAFAAAADGTTIKVLLEPN